MAATSVTRCWSIRIIKNIKDEREREKNAVICFMSNFSFPFPAESLVIYQSDREKTEGKTFGKRFDLTGAMENIICYGSHCKREYGVYSI